MLIDISHDISRLRRGFATWILGDPRHLVRALTAAAFLACLPTGASALPRFVSLTGGEANPGTIDAPWRYVSTSINRLAPGDTLYVRGGRYVEANTNVLVSGVAGSPIVIRSYPGETAIIDPTRQEYRTPGNNAWAPVRPDLGYYVARNSISGDGQAMVWIANLPGYENQRLALPRYYNNDCFLSENDQYDSTAFYAGPGYTEFDNHIRIRLAKTADMRAAEQRYGTILTEENANPASFSIVVSDAAWALGIRGSYLTFKDLVLEPGYSTVYIRQGSHDLRFEGLTVWVGRSGFATEPDVHHVTITGCRIYGDCPPWVFRSDQQTNIAPAPVSSFQSTSIGLCCGAHDWEISYNHIRGSSRHLIEITRVSPDYYNTGGTEHDVAIHHNRMENAAEDAIKITSSSDLGRVEIYENFMSNCLHALTAGKDTPIFTGPLLFYRNVVSFLRDPAVNRRPGLLTWNKGLRYGYEYLFKLSGTGFTTRNTHIYQNTLALLNSNGKGMNLSPQFPADTRCMNNLLMVVNGRVNGAFVRDNGQVVDGNLYWKINTVDTERLIDSYDTAPALHAATGLEAHGVGAAPKRGTDPRLPDLRLQVVDPTQSRWALAAASERRQPWQFALDAASPARGAAVPIPPHPVLGVLPDSHAGADIGALPYGTSAADFDFFPFDPAPNLPPSVDAGPDQIVGGGEGAMLRGQVHDDGHPRPSTLLTSWSLVSGPGRVTFADPWQPETRATFSTGGVYALALTASDGEYTVTDRVTIAVTIPAGQPPVSVDTVVTTPCDHMGWSRVAGPDAGEWITAGRPHATGSMDLSTSAGSPAVMFTRSAGGRPLIGLSNLSVDLYRGSSGTPDPSRAPEVRLLVDNGHASERYSYLIWEPAGNGYPILPADAWRSYDLGGKFWQRVPGEGAPDREVQVARTLTEWLDPGVVVDADGDSSREVGKLATVAAFEIGVAPSASGPFSGAADRFRFGFYGRDSLFDFETEQVTSILLSAPGTSRCGSEVVLTASLYPRRLTGSVVFMDGADTLGRATLVRDAIATLSVNGLMVGHHDLVARFDGGPCIAASMSAHANHQVLLLPTSVTLVTSPNPAKLPDVVTILARLDPLTAQGTVDFYDGYSRFATVPAVAGFASATRDMNAGGVYAFRAVFHGEGCRGSDSSAVVLQVVGDSPSVSVNDPIGNEGDTLTTALPFRVSLSSPSTRTVTVDYATRDSTATLADRDYVPVQGTVSFGPGETSKTVEVPIRGDLTLEGEERVVLALSHPTIATLGDSVGVGTIADDDSIIVSVPSIGAPEGDVGLTPFTITARLPKPCGETVTLDWETADGTATTADDYLPARGTLTFEPGQTSQTITVLVNGDSLFERSETFDLLLSNPENAYLRSPKATETIINDEPIPNLIVEDGRAVEGDDGTSFMTFRVCLTRVSVMTSVTALYQTIEGTAQEGTDFYPVYGKLTIPAFTRDVYVAVQLIGDRECEPDETFAVVLSHQNHGSINRNYAQGVIVNDDCLVATRIAQFTAEAVADGIELRWRLSDADGADVRVERGESSDGPWTRVEASVREDVDGSVAVDQSVGSNRSYWYRLVVTNVDGGRITSDAISAVAPERVTEFGLGGVMPNPSRGAVSIEYLVAKESLVRLSVVDVQGRRVAVLVDGLQGVGRHRAIWSSTGPAASAGLYFVRYEAAGRMWNRRVVVAR